MNVTHYDLAKLTGTTEVDIWCMAAELYGPCEADTGILVTSQVEEIEKNYPSWDKSKMINQFYFLDNVM